MQEVTKERLIVVEGKDEEDFFKRLLSQMSLQDLVEIRSVGGKDQFRRKVPALLRSRGFVDHVRSFALIRDADDNAQVAFDSLRDLLAEEGCQPPKDMNLFSEGERKVGIFIMPGNSEYGMLEDLCLRTVKDHPAMNCVHEFVECLMGLPEPPNPTHLSKVKVISFLAAMPELAISNAVGRGSLKGQWNFESEELAELREFLQELEVVTTGG